MPDLEESGDARVRSTREGAPGALEELTRFAELAARGALLGHWRGRRLESTQREDVVQETLARILEKVTRTAKPVQDLQDWVRGTVHTLLLESWRKDRSFAGVRADGETELPSAPEREPLFRALRAEEQRAVLACIADLPDPTRDMIRLRYREGLRNRQIAERLGKSEKAVELAIPRALKRLRACLERKGISR